MAIHPKDKSADNPRLQCSVCGGWMRLHRRQPVMSAGGYERTQNFYGGCPYTRGDHLAGDKSDVCDDCCHVECKRLHELSADLPDDVVAANVAFASPND